MHDSLRASHQGNPNRATAVKLPNSAALGCDWVGLSVEHPRRGAEEVEFSFCVDSDEKSGDASLREGLSGETAVAYNKHSRRTTTRSGYCYAPWCARFSQQYRSRPDWRLRADPIRNPTAPRHRSFISASHRTFLLDAATLRSGRDLSRRMNRHSHLHCLADLVPD
jgi:hypothetical protein